MTPTPAAAPGGLSVAMADLPFRIDERALIPLEDGQAVSAGWPESLGGRPLGVTWHWTVTWDLELCRRLLGGRNAERKGEASAHYGIGRGYDEGVDRYVTLENRSWHAGKSQSLRWDGKPLTSPDYKGARSTIGVETVNIGYATADGMADDDWIEAATPDGKPIRVQPWTDEQMAMMIEVGREIVARWPHIGPDDHHGHHDLCPGYKVDVSGFPFARLLRGIYPDHAIDDVWTPTRTVRQRQRALAALGHDLGATGADGQWGPRSLSALKGFQGANGLVVNGYWTTHVSRRLAEVFREQGRELAEATATPES